MSEPNRPPNDEERDRSADYLPSERDRPGREGAEPQGETPLDAEAEVLYRPAPGERQLTVRAVLAGCLLGALVAAMNISFGLRTGWSIGGSLIAAILGIAFFRAIGPRVPFTRLEANITQTAGSAAGAMASAAGLLSAIPALGLLAEDGRTVPELGYLELTLWGVAVAFLGVFFAVPLRRQMVVQEKLRFPTGTATAHTLMSMFAEGSEATQKARALVVFAIGAAAFSFAVYFVPQIETWPIEEIPWPVLSEAAGLSVFAWLAAHTFTIYVSPLMIGAGGLIGMRVAVSLCIGAVVAWGVVGPIADANGWTAVGGMSKWILWPGVAIMVTDGLTALALSWRTVLSSFVGLFGQPGDEASAEESAADDAQEQIPNAVWMGGLAIGTACTVTIAALVFDIPWWLTLIGVAMSSVLAMIATRSTGETDINPIGAMGKVTQLVFGTLSPGNLGVNIMGAAITSAGASQAGDMMQDLKTGRMLGASPRQQLVAQLCGVAGGIVVAVPIYVLFDAAYAIGAEGSTMPAPAAHSWKAMALILADGFDALPPNATWAILCGAIFGVVLRVLPKLVPSIRAALPSGLAVGIAFIVPAFYSFAMLFGAVLFLLYRRRDAKMADSLSFAIASGLIAGDGLMGIAKAVMTLVGVPTLTGEP
jgi:uncharacterized oligopeptide transporter (OPT) family protein